MAAKTETPAADAKPELSKAEKFVEIASRRTSKVIDAIGTLEGLANTTNYEYTKEQWEKIFGAVIASLEKVKARVENPKTTVAAGFTL